MFIIVSYDIPDDRRRTKVMQTLKDFGRHVQYSVFECDLKQEDYQRLRQKLEKMVNKKEDNLRFYVLSQEDLKKRRVWGPERTEVEIQDFYLVRRKRER
jgi:CRISPR-associated protein Cas2